MKGFFIRGLRLPFLLLLLPFLFLAHVSMGQYPSIPGNPTTFQNTNTPDPFGGTFYNGGSPVYTIPSNFNAYCSDRSTPVCDGTKDPLSPGATNTNNQLAYALYLLNINAMRSYGGTIYSDFVKRELIWAVMGQTNTCSANSDCATLLATVQALGVSTPMTATVTPSSLNYNVGDKIRFTINTNVSEILLAVGVQPNGNDWEFCDASGNAVSPPAGALIETYLIGNNYDQRLRIKYPVTTTTTYYICNKNPLTGKGSTCYYDYKIPGASDVSIWERPVCQTLVHLMPTESNSTNWIEWGTCADIPITIERSTSDTGSESTISGTRVFTYTAGGTIHFRTEGVNASDGCGGYQYSAIQWDGPNGFSSMQDQPSAIYPVTTSHAGIYSVTYTIGSCSPTATVSVKVCPSGSVQLTATPSSAQGNHSYHTSVPQYSVASGVNLTITTTLPSGATDVTLTHIDGNAPYYNSGGSANPVTFPYVINNFATSNQGYYVLSYSDAAGCPFSSGIVLLMGATPTANLSLQKTVSKVNPNAGESITYTVRVTNAGPDAATNVVLKDLLPAGLTYGSVSAGTYVPATGLWTIGTVPVGTTILTMTVTVN